MKVLIVIQTYRISFYIFSLKLSQLIKTMIYRLQSVTRDSTHKIKSTESVTACSFQSFVKQRDMTQ